MSVLMAMMGSLWKQAAPAIDFMYLPLTYNTDDLGTAQVFTERCAAPCVTPEGYVADGFSSRLMLSDVPAWIKNSAEPLSFYAEVSVPASQPTLKSDEFIAGFSSFPINSPSYNSRDATLNIRAISGTRPFKTVRLSYDSTDASSAILFRPEWSYRGMYPQLNSGAYQARPQGIQFLSASRLLITAHYEDQKAIAHVVHPDTLEIISQFNLDPYTHTAGIARRSNGEIWMVDYTTNNIFAIDIAASELSGNAVFTKTLTTSGFNGLSGLEFVTVGGIEYVMIADYSTSGTPYTYFFEASKLDSQTSLAITDRWKRVFLGLRIQGTRIKDGALYVSANRTSNSAVSTAAHGFIDIHPNFVANLPSYTDGQTIVAPITKESASVYTEDLDFHPVTGDIWTSTEGWSSVGSSTAWLSFWSSKLDGKGATAAVEVYTLGNSVSIKQNGREFYSFTALSSRSLTTAICIGSGSQATHPTKPLYGSNVSAATIKNFCVKNGVFTDDELARVRSGSLETRTLYRKKLSIINGDAESGTDGWVNEVGAIGTRSDLPLPYQGSAYFFGGATALCISKQRVNYFMQAHNVDPSKAWVKIKYAQSSYRGEPDATDDGGSMGIRWLDGSDYPIGADVYGALDAAPYSAGAGGPWYWYQREINIPFNQTASKLDLLYQSIRSTGTNNDYYVDVIELYLYQPDEPLE